MNVQDERRAAARLALPLPHSWTVSEYREASECVGCTASFENGTRIVYALKGCPAHGRDSA